MNLKGYSNFCHMQLLRTNVWHPSAAPDGQLKFSCIFQLWSSLALSASAFVSVQFYSIELFAYRPLSNWIICKQRTLRVLAFHSNGVVMFLLDEANQLNYAHYTWGAASFWARAFKCSKPHSLNRPKRTLSKTGATKCINSTLRNSLSSLSNANWFYPSTNH